MRSLENQAFLQILTTVHSCGLRFQGCPRRPLRPRPERRGLPGAELCTRGSAPTALSWERTLVSQPAWKDFHLPQHISLGSWVSTEKKYGEEGSLSAGPADDRAGTSGRQTARQPLVRMRKTARGEGLCSAKSRRALRGFPEVHSALWSTGSTHCCHIPG